MNMTCQKEVTIKIDMEPIYERIEKYIYKKLQERLREEIIDDIGYEIGSEIATNLSRIQVPDIQGRSEKLEDWKLDIEQGWIDLKGNKKK